MACGFYTNTKKGLKPQEVGFAEKSKITAKVKNEKYILGGMYNEFFQQRYKTK